MKIACYKKKKNNIYEIIFTNNEKIKLYDDIILKYGLLLTKEIPDNKLKTILDDNNCLESYYVALKFLNTKLRTEKEIRHKLKLYSEKAISYTLERLKKEGYLNDQLYIKAYINDAINLKVVGPTKILYELNKLGFKEQDIKDYLDNIEREIWTTKIEKYIRKKISSNHNLSARLLKQKINQELINRGFWKEDIRSSLSLVEIKEDKEIYQKEYHKQKERLSKKYQGEELEYHIKMNLLKKGFRDLD